MKRRRRLRASAVPALLGLFAASPARAEAPCGHDGRPVIELLLEVEPPDRIIGTTLEQHLRAELDARQIDVCTVTPAAPRRQAIARVTLHVEHQPSGAFLALIRVGDLITDKRVERTVDLARIPRDSRPLAVAASTDELLRASWVELTIPDAPPPVITPPPAVVRAISTPARPPPARAIPVELGLVGTGLDHFGHRIGLGTEAWVGLFVHPRVAVQLRFAADAGLPRASPHGSARADTLGPGAALVVALPDHRARLGVRLEGMAQAMRVHLTGTTSGAATATDGALWTGVAGAAVRGWARTGPVSWTIGVGAVAALHTVAATDDGTPVTSIQGVGGRVDAGLTYTFH